ncbi:MAG: hypothetical protein EXS67_01090 [Candidatus Margulisbacteria bacterium]|nr:hypothetical protein [Candidatus Margulisiibacteriota bacterium]
MKKHIVLLSLFVLIGISSIQAGISYNLSDFETQNGTLSIGSVQENGKNFFKIGGSPDLTFGPLQVGLDINAYIGKGTPSSLQPIVLRRIAYDHNHIAGFEWGRLQHVTYGQGLLIDNYDSGSFGSSELNNDKVGIKGYLDIHNIRVDAFHTASQVFGGRLSYTLSETFLMNSPLVFGGNYIKDQNGINKTIESNTIIRPVEEAWSADISMPIGGVFFTPYVEYAELTKGQTGKGQSLGIKGDFIVANYKLEYRSLEAGFIPGYFNESYEATSLDAANTPKDKTNGFLGAFSASLNDYIKGGIIYENYAHHTPLLTGAIGWHKIGNTTGVANYTRSFTGDDNAILNSDILYSTDNGLDYVVHFKRIYFKNGKQEDTYSVSLRFGLKAFGLPF